MVAFVTGGASGIGKSIALTFAKNGYDVAFSYLSSADAAEAVAEEIRAMGRKCVALKADVSRYEEVQAMFASFGEIFDRLDVFINNAGVTKTSKFLETTEEGFDQICNVDFKGAYFAMQGAAKLMVEKKIEGSIIAISSNNAMAHFADASVYGSTKAALTKLVEHVAVELARYRIRANTVAPGWTDTGAKRLGEKEDTYYKIPLNKWAEPSEISETCLFLASPAARSITGATIVIDNGALLVSDKRERYGF